MRGQRCSTTLDTLLADSRSVLFGMFEPMARGAEPVNAATARAAVAAAGGRAEEGVPGARRARPGPLPQGADGAYFIDRDPVSFRYILNHLCDLELAAADAAEPEPEPEGAEEARAAAAEASMPLSVPDSVGDRAQLAREARHYGLDELAQACSSGAAEVHSLASLAASSGPGVTVADILALPAEDLKTLLKELHVNIVLTARITAEVEAERVRRQAEIEAERAVEALRAKLVKAECPVSATVARVLHAAGLGVRDLTDMDEAAARRLGLSAEDARLIGVFEVPGIQCPYPGEPFGEGGCCTASGPTTARRPGATRTPTARSSRRRAAGTMNTEARTSLWGAAPTATARPATSRTRG
eukprot:COSAG04_NODE_496_length_13410_cov_8.377733_4_plen_357_part_00